MSKKTALNWLSIEQEATPQITDLLEKSVWGTPTKSMLYTHCNAKHKAANITAPYFVSLKRHEKIMGLGCFCNYQIWNQDTLLDSYYIRYFSFKDAYQIAHVTKQNKYAKKSHVKEELTTVLSTDGLATPDQKTLFYAYVDPGNERSINLCNHFGFHPIRSYTTCLFSRMSPKRHKDVTKCSTADKSTLAILLKDQYADYNMFSTRNLFFEDNYYVIKNADGEILAGVQANAEHWHIHEMPGFSGKLILNVLPKLPILNQLFNPDYRFVALEGLYLKEGHEQSLMALLESVLAIHQLKSALIWLDTDSKLYTTITDVPKGLMNYFYDEKEVQIIAKPINLDKQELDALKTQPAYISAFDMT